MLGNVHLDRLRQQFSDQFEPEQDGFRYRKSMKGPAIRVSSRERDDFVAAFNRRIRYASWSIFPATLVLILLLVWLVPDIDSPLAQVALYVGLAAILIPFTAILYWAWNAPSRELKRRLPVGAALSRDELRKLTFSRMTYGQLAIAVLFGLGLVWRMSAETDVFHGWGMIWLLVGGLLIVAAGVQAFRKWRYSQRLGAEP